MGQHGSQWVTLSLRSRTRHSLGCSCPSSPRVRACPACPRGFDWAQELRQQFHGRLDVEDVFGFGHGCPSPYVHPYKVGSGKLAPLFAFRFTGSRTRRLARRLPSTPSPEVGDEDFQTYLQLHGPALLVQGCIRQTAAMKAASLAMLVSCSVWTMVAVLMVASLV
jgi:hypothetical protein